MAMSDEAKKDLKIKITVAVIVVLVGGPLLALGPGMPSIVKHYREKRAEPDSPKRLLQCAQLMDMTMREDEAQKLYDDLYLMYSGNDWEADFELVLEELGTGDDQAFYLPWLVKDYDGMPGVDPDDPDIVNRRPAPVSSTRHPIMGEVLQAKAKYLEDARLYGKCRHIYRCLFYMWPDGSPEKAAGKAAEVRHLSRSF